MTFDLISGLHMQIQTWHPHLRLCIHAKYYVKSGLKTQKCQQNQKYASFCDLDAIFAVGLIYGTIFIVFCLENCRRNIQLLCLGRESSSLCNNSQIVRKIYSHFGIESQFGSLFNL